VATTWGSYSNRLRMGIDMVLSGSVTQSSPDVNVDVSTYTDTDYSTYNYDINWTRTTSAGSTKSGSTRLTQSAAVKLESFTSAQTASYSSSKTYEVSVSGSGSSAGPASHSRTVTIPRRPTAAPSSPGTPAVSNITATSMDVTWTAPTDLKGTTADYYKLEVATSSYFTNIVQNITSEDRVLTVYGLDPDKDYYLRVRLYANGWDANRWSSYSGTREAHTQVGVPSPVGGRAISGITSSGFTSTWEVPNGNGAAVTKYGYEVRLGDYPDSRTGTIVKAAETTTTSFTIGNLSPYTTYSVHHRAYNGQWGPWQVDATTWGAQTPTTLANPPTLTSVNAYNISRTSAMIGGAVIANNGGQPPTSLRTQYNTTASTTGATIKTSGGVWASIQLDDLVPLTTYYYRGSAANSAGWGEWTAWKSFTTLDAVPSNPAAPTVTSITETSAIVNWVAPALNGTVLSGYLVMVSQLNDSDAPEQTFEVGPTVLSQKFSNLAKGTQYYAFVKAHAVPNDSGWSPSKAFKTLGVSATLFPALNIDGVWHDVIESWSNNGGVWQRIKLGLNVDGVWKESV
jgi:hypothetical protein